jgi:hypothetical protein
MSGFLCYRPRGMKGGLRRVAAVAVALGAVGCGSQPQAGWATPANRAPVAASAGPVDCARLQARAPGIEGCPPANLALDRPSVAHAAGVSDADAQHMAEGFARSYAIANWAINQGYAAFLQSGLLSSTQGQATSSSFGEDLRQMYLAQRAGARYRVDPPLKLAAAWATPLPAAASAQARSLQLAAGPDALALAFQGPYAAYAGTRVVNSYATNYTVRVLVFGELRNDADMGGWLWSWGGYVSCDQQWAEGLCRV